MQQPIHHPLENSSSEDSLVFELFDGFNQESYDDSDDSDDSDEEIDSANLSPYEFDYSISSSSDNAYDFDEFEEFEDIYNEDLHHLDSDKTNGTYYIGLCKYIRRENILLFLNSVSSKTFLKHPFERIKGYLVLHTIMIVRSPKIHIMKLEIQSDGTYSVVLKTHWLRLVQRHWRKIYQERCAILEKRRSIMSIRHMQTTGYYLPGLNSLPHLAGMMNMYPTKKNITNL